MFRGEHLIVPPGLHLVFVTELGYEPKKVKNDIFKAAKQIARKLAEMAKANLANLVSREAENDIKDKIEICAIEHKTPVVKTSTKKTGKTGFEKSTGKSSGHY